MECRFGPTLSRRASEFGPACTDTARTSRILHRKRPTMLSPEPSAFKPQPADLSDFAGATPLGRSSIGRPRRIGDATSLARHGNDLLQQASAEIRKRDHERHRTQRRRIKTEANVERCGVLRKRVDDETADADRVRCIDHAPRSVLKQSPADPFPWCDCATASRPRTTTGIGSGMFRRNFPGALATATALEASA